MKSTLLIVLAFLLVLVLAPSVTAERLCAADTCVREALYFALEREPLIEAHELWIDYIEGRAFFHGVVDNEEIRQLVTDTALQVSRVYSVGNYLRVREEEEEEGDK